MIVKGESFEKNLGQEVGALEKGVSNILKMVPCSLEEDPYENLPRLAPGSDEQLPGWQK